MVQADLTLPFIVFPLLSAVACHFVFGHLHQSSLDVASTNACASGLAEPSPYRLRYVHLDAIDNTLCSFVTFFQTALNHQDSFAFVTYFIGIGAPLVVVPAVEGWRAGRSRIIAYPVIFGVISQIMTVGLTMPLYWLIFILAGGTRSRYLNPRNANISQAAAEAVAFGIIVGAVIPSVGMLVLNDPYVTAIWLPFPIYISLAQYMHLLFRPESRYPQSGYQTICGLYIATFILCSSVHIATIWPIIGGDLRMLRVFIPSVTIPPTAMEHEVHHLLKWDFAVALTSSILITLWFAKSKGQLVLLAAWSAFATPVFGPGAAMMGTFLWRETSLQNYVDVNSREHITDTVTAQ